MCAAHIMAHMPCHTHAVHSQIHSVQQSQPDESASAWPCLACAPAVSDEADPTAHATALACLKEKCPDIGLTSKSTAHVLAAN